MHVHGVFPYLYVPYNRVNNSIDADQLTYQISSSLDKAINISLGQAHSNTEHIFKIVHVKAMLVIHLYNPYLLFNLFFNCRPFYGYHSNEHQFLKIYFYNPHFVKRAANLLQNGAILGKVFQPHESHVPYILQFFIDYNLYGMSFLHVPSDVVRYRTSTTGGMLNV